MKRHPRNVLCTCAECAELDLEFPGEGRQLAFALPTERKRARPRAAKKQGSAVQ